MPFSNVAAQFVAFRLGSSLPNDFIGAFGIGSGSGTASVSNVTLQNEVLRNIITGSPDFTAARKVSFQGDFNSVQMSGISLREFGLFKSGLVNTGSVWFREAFGSVVFNGNSELQLLTTLEVIAGS